MGATAGGEAREVVSWVALEGALMARLPTMAAHRLVAVRRRLLLPQLENGHAAVWGAGVAGVGATTGVGVGNTYSMLALAVEVGAHPSPSGVF